MSDRALHRIDAIHRRMADHLATRRQGREAPDDGYILVVVIGLSLLMLSLSAVVMTSANNNQAVTTVYQRALQSHLAAETGLNVAVGQLSAAVLTVPSSTDGFGNLVNAQGGVLRNLLPAGIALTTVGTASRYIAPITYYTSAGVAFVGAPSTWALTSPTWPASATVTSTGTTTNGASAAMVENLTITAPTASTAPSTPVLLSGYGPALFSLGQVALSGNVQATTNSVTTPADVVSGAGIVCPNNVVVQGSVYSYSTSDISLANNCSISGGLYGAAGITLSNSVTVGGDTWAYGSDGITLNNSNTIGGNAVAVAGPIIVYTPAVIAGNATAAGAITYNTGGQSAYGSIKGLVTPNNAKALSGSTITPEPPFPVFADPAMASWQASEYTNYISVTSAGESINGGAVNASEGCSAYFSNQFPAPSYSAAPSQFNLDVNSATTPTVIDAPTCSAPNIYGPNAVSTFTLHTDVAVVLSGLQTSGTNTFASATTATHNLAFIVPSPQTGAIALANSTTFANTLSVLFYTNGNFSAANASTVRGQVLAANSIQGSNGFALLFSSNAALTLPGTTSSTVGAVTAAAGSLSALRRYVVR
jgi:fibronectin-binding autotransporter adhesin